MVTVDVNLNALVPSESVSDASTQTEISSYYSDSSYDVYSSQII